MRSKIFRRYLLIGINFLCFIFVCRNCRSHFFPPTPGNFSFVTMSLPVYHRILWFLPSSDQVVDHHGIYGRWLCCWSCKSTHYFVVRTLRIWKYNCVCGDARTVEIFFCTYILFDATYNPRKWHILVQLQSGNPLDETSIACITRDLLHAVEYLHNEGKIHRDIKGFVCVNIIIMFYGMWWIVF